MDEVYEPKKGFEDLFAELLEEYRASAGRNADEVGIQGL